MDKKVVFAVAGAGKTTNIIKQLNLADRSMVITYTNNNIRNIREGILKQFSYFPENITLLSYFTFLYSFCCRPFLSYRLKTRGINFNNNLNFYIKKSDPMYYFDKHKRIYSNRIAKLLEVEDVLEDINSRLSKYYDNLFIDEIQDFAGHDFNFLESISRANLNMTFVGDFFQYTFDTSRDGKVNGNLHKNYSQYKGRFRDMGMDVDTSSLNKSFRCSPTICKFITDKIGIDIFSHRGDETSVRFIDNAEDGEKVFKNKDIVKLFYQEHYKYGCYSRNWGDCKGEDRFSDVCVVLNKTTLEHFKKDSLSDLNPKTKNKLYVACSRAGNNLFFISYQYFEKYKNGIETMVRG